MRKNKLTFLNKNIYFYVLKKYINNISMNDKELINRIKNDNEQFWEIIDIYSEKILKYIMRISDIEYEDAENMLQDIFIKIFKNLNDYNENYTLSSWIFRIAHNMTIDNHRKLKAKPQNISLEDEEYNNLISSLSDYNDPHKSLRLADTKKCVQNSISSLKKNYKEIIILKFINWYSYDEISDILKMPIWTVSTLINRAKQELKLLLSDNNCL